MFGGTVLHKTIEKIWKQTTLYNISTIESQASDYFVWLWNTLYQEHTLWWLFTQHTLQEAEDFKEKYKDALSVFIQKYFIKDIQKNFATWSDIKHHWAEVRVYCDLWKEKNNTKKLVCIIDNVLYKQSNNRIKDLHIIDYKSTYREENLKAHTKQLYTYAYALLQNEVFAQVKNITWTLHYVLSDYVETYTISKEDIEQAIDTHRQNIDTIEQKIFYYNFGDSNAFSPQKNQYCWSCEYKNICPLWNKN